MMKSDEKLNPDVELVERAIFYDIKTGEIVGSHFFGASGHVSEQGRRRFESLLQSQLEDLQKRHDHKLAIHRSEEANQLDTLNHRVDLSTGKLVALSPKGLKGFVTP